MPQPLRNCIIFWKEQNIQQADNKVSHIKLLRHIESKFYLPLGHHLFTNINLLCNLRVIVGVNTYEIGYEFITANLIVIKSFLNNKKHLG